MTTLRCGEDEVLVPAVEPGPGRAPADDFAARLAEALEHIDEVVVAEQGGDVVEDHRPSRVVMQLAVDLDRHLAGAEQMVRTGAEHVQVGVDLPVPGFQTTTRQSTSRSAQARMCRWKRP